MENLTAASDIQEQRKNERLTAALEAAPIAKKQIAALRKKAEAIAAEAAEVEAKQVQAFATLESLKQARAAATVDLATLLQLKLSADNANVETKSQIIRLLASNRGLDPFGKTNFLLTIDSIARLKVIAPMLPELLAEKQATIERLDEQIKRPLDSSIQ
jgi:hypothetical protein